MRTAIERHAVNWAIDYYVQLGYDVRDVGAYEPFDLLVTDEKEQRRIEVKGSSGSVESVELTHGEVRNATGKAITDLFVVDQIEWWREPDGSVSTAGGQERVHHDWTPDSGDLEAIRYRYRIPKNW